MLGLLLILISKSWGAPPRGLGMPFLRQGHMRRGVGGWGDNLFLPDFLPCMMPSMYEWRDGRMDGRITWWKKLHGKRPRHPLLYVTTTNIPNHYLPCMKSHLPNLLPHQHISNPLTLQTSVNMSFQKPNLQTHTTHTMWNLANLVHFASDPGGPKIGQKRKNQKEYLVEVVGCVCMCESLEVNKQTHT